MKCFSKVVTILSKRGIVVGDGTLRKELEERYKNITFVGWKDTKEVNEYLKQSKSINFFLLYGMKQYGINKAIEALAMGILVLSGNNCSSMEYIEDGKMDFYIKWRFRRLSN